MSQLDKIEKRIRDIFEKSPELLPWSDRNDQAIMRLCEGLRALFRNEIPREFLHPRFKFTLNPVTETHWRSQSEWEVSLADMLISTAGEFGFQFRTWPEIELTADHTLAVEEINISLIDVPYPPGRETGVISIDSQESAENTGKELRKIPSLILQGDRTVELSLPVINIGRKRSNHIAINDLRISRNHAQLRKIKENYMIFDVGSSGGTFINSTRIESHVLRPGDVISLAGYTMIYTFDQSPVDETRKGITSELKSSAEEEET